MTISQLLERLEKKRDALDVAILEIRQASAATSTKKKAASIIKSIRSAKRKPMKYKKGKHWTQTPEGREILRQRQLKFWKGKK